MKTSQEISGGFLVACCDGSKVLDGVEETLDQVAFAIEREVAGALDGAVRFGRDHHLDGARCQGRDEMVGVVSVVGEQGCGLDLRQQRIGLCDVMDLSTGGG
jgi:hypothetical protein